MFGSLSWVGCHFRCVFFFSGSPWQSWTPRLPEIINIRDNVFSPQFSHGLTLSHGTMRWTLLCYIWRRLVEVIFCSFYFNYVYMYSYVRFIFQINKRLITRGVVLLHVWPWKLWTNWAYCLHPPYSPDLAPSDFTICSGQWNKCQVRSLPWLFLMAQTTATLVSPGTQDVFLSDKIRLNGLSRLRINRAMSSISLNMYRPNVTL